MIKYPYYPKQLVLVRHGQSLLNVIQAKAPSFFVTAEDRKPFIGFPDHKVGLTEKGIAQARQTGKALREKNYKFDVAYDSGYERTVQTLDFILESFSENNLVRCHDISLREREAGYTYCMIKEEAESEFKWLQEYWNTLGPVLARPVGGESVADVITRVQVALLHIFHAYEDKRVLISVHGRVLTTIRYLLENWSLDDLHNRLSGNKNCGVTRYEFNQNKRCLELAEYNTIYW